MREDEMQHQLEFTWATGPNERIRKVVRRSNAKVTGKYPSWKMGRMLQWESFLERDAMVLHDVDTTVSRFKEQHVCLGFELDGEKHVHYPDLYVETTEGRVFREIKTNKDAADAFVLARAKHLEAALLPRGYRYELLAESEIRREPRLSNAKTLLRYGRNKVSLDEYELLRRRVERMGVVTWGDACQGRLGQKGRALIARMVLEGKCRMNLDASWDETTQINTEWMMG